MEIQISVFWLLALVWASAAVGVFAGLVMRGADRYLGSAPHSIKVTARVGGDAPRVAD